LTFDLQIYFRIFKQEIAHNAILMQLYIVNLQCSVPELILLFRVRASPRLFARGLCTLPLLRTHLNWLCFRW